MLLYVLLLYVVCLLLHYYIIISLHDLCLFYCLLVICLLAWLSSLRTSCPCAYVLTHSSTGDWIVPFAQAYFITLLLDDVLCTCRIEFLIYINTYIVSITVHNVMLLGCCLYRAYPAFVLNFFRIISFAVSSVAQARHRAYDMHV